MSKKKLDIVFVITSIDTLGTSVTNYSAPFKTYKAAIDWIEENCQMGTMYSITEAYTMSNLDIYVK